MVCIFPCLYLLCPQLGPNDCLQYLLNKQTNKHNKIFGFQNVRLSNSIKRLQWLCFLGRQSRIQPDLVENDIVTLASGEADFCF